MKYTAHSKPAVCISLFLCTALCVLSTSCRIGETVSEKRLRLLDKPRNDILIGIVWPFEVRKDHFRQGAEMAVNEINGSGGVLGVELRLVFADDKASLREARVIAQRFSENAEIAFVIGHYNSYAALPASRLYHFNRLPFMTPGATTPRLTRQGFDMLFRSIPSDSSTGERLAQYSAEKDYSRVALIGENTEYGRGLIESFENTASDLNIDIASSVTYDRADSRTFRWLLDGIAGYTFDAILVAGTLPGAGTLLREIRRAGFDQPVIGGDGLDSNQIFKSAGKAAEGIRTVSVFARDNPRKHLRRFVDQYKGRYGHNPDTWAAQAYNSVHIVAAAMARAESAAPGKVTAALKSGTPLPATWCTVTFTPEGEIRGLPVMLKKAKDGKYVFTGEITGI